MSYSMQELLDWMRQDSRLLNWGMIVAIDRGKGNRLLTQAYIAKFDQHSQLPAFGGEVNLTADRKEVIKNFVLSVPRLSFENADLNDSKAMLTMDVMGGTQVSMEQVTGNAWNPTKLDRIDPLQGPQLFLDLLLSDVAGSVDDGGIVVLDLSKSDNFRLTFAEAEHARELGGRFFKELFNQLPAEKRVYPLGKIQPGSHELFKSQSFGLRTQANNSVAARDPRSSEFGDGAILTFVRMAGSDEGNYPGVSSGFRYLIPNDAQQAFSATVMVDSNRMMLTQMAESLREELGFSDFAFEVDSQTQTFFARAQTGAGMSVGSNVGRIEVDVPLPGLPGSATAQGEFSCSGGVLNLGDALVQSMNGKISVSFSLSGSLMCECNCTGDDRVMPWLVAHGGTKFERPCHLQFKASVEYELPADQTSVVLVRKRLDVTPDLLGSTSALTAGDGISSSYEEIVSYIQATIARRLADDISNGDILTFLQNALASSVPLSVGIDKAFDEVVHMNFGEAIHLEQRRSPNDIVGFGKVNPALTAFVIDPLTLTVGVDTPTPFNVIPAQTDVTWSVENVDGTPGSAGTIDRQSGLYCSPPAADIEGEFTQVRITATKGDFSSFALVTVVRNSIAVNPLIQLMKYDESLPLKAGSLREGSATWRIKNPIDDKGSLESNGLECTYVRSGTSSSDDTYLLEEIEVEVAGEPRSSWIVIRQWESLLTLRVEHYDGGGAQFKAKRRNNADYSVEWSLAPDSPGSIDAVSGYYSASAESEKHFAIIFAKDGGVIDGCFILPLPLGESQEVLKLASQKHKRVRRG